MIKKREQNGFVDNNLRFAQKSIKYEKIKPKTIVFQFIKSFNNGFIKEKIKYKIKFYSNHI